MDTQERIFYKCLLIRETELLIESLFSQGLLRGTIHGCVGQEAVPVIISELTNIEKDYICSGHRSHGYALAISDDIAGLVGELMGKECGYAKGKGGSQHILYKNFFTNGITGGMVPVAAGLAYSLKLTSDDAIAIVAFGDGAMNEGYVMETFNLASLKNLPLLFVLENNGYAMSTPVKSSTAGSIQKRVEGFGIPYKKITMTDFDAAYEISKSIINNVRTERSPYFIEYVTHRFSGHSKSDNRSYIKSEEDEYWRKNDFMNKFELELNKGKVMQIREFVQQKIRKSLMEAENSGIIKTLN